MEPMRSIIGDFFVKKGRRGDFSAFMKVLAAWEDIAGTSVAKVAAPKTLQNGTLTVVCENSAWANELMLLAPSIIEKIKTHTRVAVTDFRTKVGEIVRREEPEHDDEPVPLSTDDEAWVEHALNESEIEDDELRVHYANVLRAHRRRMRFLGELE